MSDCTHNCSTCGGGCHFELEDGQKPRDVLNEIKEFVKSSEGAGMSEFFENLAKEMEAAM